MPAQQRKVRRPIVFFVALCVTMADLRAQTAPAAANSRSPNVAPDGKTIAFLSDRDGRKDQLYLINVDGTGERQVPIESAGHPWFADGGRTIRYAGFGADSGRMFSVSIDGSGLTILATVAGRSVALSPDGRYAAYLSGPWTSTATMVSRADGTNAHVVAGGRTTAWNAAWSPDGKRIAYTYGDGEVPLQIHLVNPDGTGDHALTASSPDVRSSQVPAWSRDGTRLAVQAGTGEKGGGHVGIVDVRTGHVTLLAPHTGYIDEMPAWFPDGKRLAFQTNRSGHWEVWVMNTDGSGAVQITGRGSPTPPGGESPRRPPG